MNPDDLLHRLADVARDPPEPASACPGDATLEAFKSHGLNPAEHDVVEKHLADCAACVDRLVTLDADLPRMSWRTRARVLSATRPERDSVRHGMPRWLLGAIPVVATAAAVLFLLPRPATPALPDYAFQLGGAMMMARGSPGGAGGSVPATTLPAEGTSHTDGSSGEGQGGGGMPVYTPGSVLILAAAPELAPPASPPWCVLYLEDPAGTVRRIRPDPTPNLDAASGAIEVRLPLGPLLGRRFGHYRINALLGPQGTKAPETLARDGSDRPPGSRLFHADFVYQASP